MTMGMTPVIHLTQDSHDLMIRRSCIEWFVQAVQTKCLGEMLDNCEASLRTFSVYMVWQHYTRNQV